MKNQHFFISLCALFLLPFGEAGRGFCQVGIGTTTPTGMLHIKPISAAAIIIDDYGAGAGQTGELQFRELAANGTNYSGFKAPDIISANIVWVLPAADGTYGQILTTNGSGSLSWANGTGGGWEELGKTTLTSVADSITVNGLPARKYLWIEGYHIPSGSVNGQMRFNSDVGASYSRRASDNGGAEDIPPGAENELSFDISFPTQPVYFSIFIINTAAGEKMGIIHTCEVNTAGAATAPDRREYVFKWANTIAQITRVDVINPSAGDFASGSFIKVLGRD